MKYLTLIFVLSFVTPASFAESVDLSEIPRPRLNFINPFYSSKGFTLGEIGTIRHEGLPIWRFRYEGSLMQGIGNIPGPLIDNGCDEQRDALITDRWRRGLDTTYDELGIGADGSLTLDPCVLGHNPFPFSFFSRRTADKLKHMLSGPKIFYILDQPLRHRLY